MGLLEPEPVPIDVTGFRFQDRNIFESRCLLVQCVPGLKPDSPMPPQPTQVMFSTGNLWMLWDSCLSPATYGQVSIPQGACTSSSLPIAALWKVKWFHFWHISRALNSPYTWGVVPLYCRSDAVPIWKSAHVVIPRHFDGKAKSNCLCDCSQSLGYEKYLQQCPLTS